ncbi:hypothetical protein ACFQT0_04520 [Hymenobacter humi]|uniref:DUF420 domain-containing protein n=1 Tax=Hymenobacter humi TaxID=1411620 RepID=A0ABW2TZS9_9BACT
MWQVMAANHLLYWVVALEVLRSPRPANQAGWARQVVLLSAVALSFMSGLYYMYAIATTGTYH